MPLPMEHEVEVAVGWWTAFLERADSESVDTPLRRSPVGATGQVEAFRAAFRVALTAYLGPTWRPDEPTWGQGTRAFGVRYGPECGDRDGAGRVWRVGVRVAADRDDDVDRSRRGPRARRSTGAHRNAVEALGMTSAARGLYGPSGDVSASRPLLPPARRSGR